MSPPLIKNVCDALIAHLSEIIDVCFKGGSKSERPSF